MVLSNINFCQFEGCKSTSCCLIYIFRIRNKFEKLCFFADYLRFLFCELPKHIICCFILFVVLNIFWIPNFYWFYELQIYFLNYGLLFSLCLWCPLIYRCLYFTVLQFVYLLLCDRMGFMSSVILPDMEAIIFLFLFKI